MKYLLALLLLFVVRCENEVKVKFTEIESPVSTVVWCGASVVFTKDDETVEQTHNEERKVLFVLSDKGRVWRSSDYGVTWIEETNNWEKMEADSKSLIFESIQISPADSRTIFFFGTQGVSYKSKNCGRTYTRFTHSEDLYDFKLNKMDTQWIMAFKDKPCGKNDINCRDYYKKSIYVTEDGGETWRSALNYVRDATWDKLLQYQLIPDQRIIACHVKDGKAVISYSDDYFQTVEVMQENAMGFFQTTHYIFVLVKEDEKDETFQLMVAPAYIDKFKATEISLPIQMNQHTFTILDTSEGQIFLSVSHVDNNQRLTNVYVSDFRGFKFTLSLLHNVRSIDTGNCDFERIMGMEGVYIANVYDHSEVQKAKSRTSAANNLELYKKSFISYDRGGQWHPLKAPQVDSRGEEIHCSGDCSLHLKGRTEANQNPIYSSANAAGIALGVGNAGLYLTQKDYEINTYLTRDGGHTWYEIKKGSHMYEIGDRGGLIVMGQDDKPITNILYSWDEGLTWSEINISQKEFEIQNIVTEPSNMEQKFIVYGQSKQTDNEMKGYIIALNFQTLHTRVCSGSWDPTMPESDYEFWIPKNFENGKCLFGRKIKYIRRKREAQCFNQEEIDKKLFIETCPCIEDDWECDFGFYRKIEGGPCVPLASNFEEDDTPDVLKPPKECHKFYFKTRGYRKVSGDYCQGGVELGPVQTPCPDEAEKQQQQQQQQQQNQGNNNQQQQQQQQEQINNQTIKAQQQQPQKLDQINQEQRQDNNLLWKIILVIGTLIFIYMGKDKILELINKKKQKPSGQSYMGEGGYEKLRLFNRDDDDDDEAGL